MLYVKGADSIVLRVLFVGDMFCGGTDRTADELRQRRWNTSPSQYSARTRGAARTPKQRPKTRYARRTTTLAANSIDAEKVKLPGYQRLTGSSLVT